MLDNSVGGKRHKNKDVTTDTRTFLIATYLNNYM